MAKTQKILAFAGSLREHSYTKRIVRMAMRGEEMTNEKMKSLLENLGASLFDTLKKLHGEIELVTCTRR